MDVLETLANQPKTDGHKMVQHSRRLVGELLAKYKEGDRKREREHSVELDERISEYGVCDGGLGCGP